MFAAVAAAAGTAAVLCLQRRLVGGCPCGVGGEALVGTPRLGRGDTACVGATQGGGLVPQGGVTRAQGGWVIVAPRVQRGTVPVTRSGNEGGASQCQVPAGPSVLGRRQGQSGGGTGTVCVGDWVWLTGGNST
ncbi:hypothetical protein E2C01_065184 [Portunus trituberculatus]|uniref:Secreted protein n=1 Tax=Portunus trituberculatus TaxID=210409 RepID=A0A5B7HDT9_PORTR|nr:hypothetical protein [Portunus trituberculatus]